MTGEVGFVCGVKKSLVQIEFSDDDDWYAVVSQLAHRAGLLKGPFIWFFEFLIISPIAIDESGSVRHRSNLAAYDLD